MLPRGITGFWSAKTELPPISEARAFRQLCHLLARENGGTVAEVDTDTAARNFYFAQLCRYDASVFILQNIHSYYAAFARREISGEFVLVRQPEWVRLPESQVHFLGLDELSQDWRDLSGALSPEEREQIRYWNPQTVGEILFNGWD